MNVKSELKGIYPITEIDSFIYIIFENLLNYSRTQLIIDQERIIESKILEKINSIVSELKTCKPIQYIIGKTEFYNLLFFANAGVLIPRPETEELVQWVISENKNSFYKILDIGSGSGCISVSLAKNMPGSVVYATDISKDALELTRKNSKLNHVELQILQFDILKNTNSLNEKFDIIISNPPYVTEAEKEKMHRNVLEFEPHLALFVPDTDPLLFYRHIADFALTHLNKNGKIYLEINEQFGKDISKLLEEKKFREICIKKDLNGKDRMIKCLLT